MHFFTQKRKEKKRKEKKSEFGTIDGLKEQNFRFKFHLSSGPPLAHFKGEGGKGGPATQKWNLNQRYPSPLIFR